jgi:hypothetical protein
MGEKFLLNVTDEFFVAPRLILIENRKDLCQIISLLEKNTINSITVLDEVENGRDFLEELKNLRKPEDLEFGKEEEV